MIHYPEDKMAQMVEGLASHADERLIISFAPNTWYYRALKSFGELFPGPSKTTRACELPRPSRYATRRCSGVTGPLCRRPPPRRRRPPCRRPTAPRGVARCKLAHTRRHLLRLLDVHA